MFEMYVSSYYARRFSQVGSVDLLFVSWTMLVTASLMYTATVTYIPEVRCNAQKP